MNNQCDEFAKDMVNAGLTVESRSYLELACALEDKDKELEAKDKLIVKLKMALVSIDNIAGTYPQDVAIKSLCEKILTSNKESE